MHKDSLILLLMLGVCFLMAACDVPWENNDEKPRPLPDRAQPSSPLLAAYYNTRDFPKEMRELKIPEGDDFDDEQITIEFKDMGSVEVVTEIRSHLYLMPPEGVAFADCELVCRCIAPNGTKSQWKALDIESEQGVDPQAEVSFLFEFDGLVSAGTWKIQIRDYLEDKDGRCLFRNGSLHINRGEAAGLGGAASETVTLTGAQGNYGLVPEEDGERLPFDLGWIGIDKLLRNDFVFTSSFFVQSVRIRAAFYADSESAIETDGVFLIVSPSGNWFAGAWGETTNAALVISSSLSLIVYDFTLGSTPDGLLMNLNGEPSAGTWSLYLVDVKRDNNTVVLTTDGTDNVAIQPGTGSLELELTGIN